MNKSMVDMFVPYFSCKYQGAEVEEVVAAAAAALPSRLSPGLMVTHISCMITFLPQNAHA